MQPRLLPISGDSDGSLLMSLCHLQPDELTNALEISNIVFTSMFALEMLLKLLACGPLGYIRNPYNIFDGIIVVIRWVPVSHQATVPGGSSVRAGPRAKGNPLPAAFAGGLQRWMPVESLPGTESLPAGTVGYTQVSCTSDVRVSRLLEPFPSGTAGVPWPFSFSAGLGVSAAAASAQKGAESLGKVPPPGGSGALPLAGG